MNSAASGEQSSVDRVLSLEDTSTSSIPHGANGNGSASITNESISSASTATKNRFSFYNAKEVSTVEQDLHNSRDGQKRFNFYVPDHVQIVAMQEPTVDDVNNSSSNHRTKSNSNQESQPNPVSDNATAVSTSCHSSPNKSSSSTNKSRRKKTTKTAPITAGTETQKATRKENQKGSAKVAQKVTPKETQKSTPKITPKEKSTKTIYHNSPKTSISATSTSDDSECKDNKHYKTQRKLLTANTNSNTPIIKNSSSLKGKGNNMNVHSSEILQSLKDTEQMRNNLMEQTSAENLHQISLTPEGKESQPSFKIKTEEYKEKHKTNVVQNSPDLSAASKNPYENAIREALDLLRKHRAPEARADVDEGVSDEASKDANMGSDGRMEIDWNMFSPGEVDPVLESRMVDLDSNTNEIANTPTYQADIEARRKQRQERMARYASRLAELKNDSLSSSAAPETTTSTARKTTTIEAAAATSITSEMHSIRTKNCVSPPQILQRPSSLSMESSQGPGIHDISAVDYPLECASSLSASCKHVDDVQRSVERVLLAILERANSTGRERSPSTTNNNNDPNHRDGADISWQQGEEKKSSSMEEIEVGQRSSSPNLDENDSDPLVRVVGEILSTGPNSIASSFDNTPSQSCESNGSASNLIIPKRSVVDELLAEPESDLERDISFSSYHNIAGTKTKPQHIKIEQSYTETTVMNDYTIEPNKTDPEAHKDSTAELTMQPLYENADDLEELVCMFSSSKNKDNSDEVQLDEDNDILEEDEDVSYGAEDDISKDALDGVLGPLSKKAGGTTGVVLDPSSPTRAQGDETDPSIFDSLANTMSSFVAQAISTEEKSTIQSKASLRDKYSTDMDDEVEAEEEEESDEDLDPEANDLMRTLCAHLLPFGVDQSSQLLDKVPFWDDSNPNEAGYRIIRLTNQQLQRVEVAFDNMVSGLKKDSERSLNRINGDGTGDESDPTFARELEAAEKLLDREEKRKETVMKAMSIVQKANLRRGGSGVQVDSPVDDHQSTNDDVSSTHEQLESQQQQEECHPDFPSVRQAGRGEMGDLEYFHLPIVYKSHVTGFEPTKDMFLEAGNVVAGQYLVESELGSAAFSTAYRCVDLYSDAGENGDEGHEEVCLKVIKNTKDFFDQSLDEIKILELLRQTGKCNENHILEMKAFFYHREHLIIVTELLRQNLFEFGKFILDHDEEPYFNLQRLGYITRQVLISLRFVHNLGLVHSDVKPENILLGSYSRAQVKVIDFGSSCYLTDRQSSYIQSRSYRAPEVVLGLPYDGRIDIWSLGCVIAEMYTGEVTFQNDSVVSMLSRIEAICGPFPRHMIAQGRQSRRFFTRCGLLYESVGGNQEDECIPQNNENDDQDGSKTVFDIFQPKTTTLSSRLGFNPDLMERHGSDIHREDVMFVDFVRKMLTVDPGSRLTAAEALQHPWMILSSTLEEEDIKYPSQ